MYCMLGEEQPIRQKDLSYPTSLKKKDGTPAEEHVLQKHILVLI